MPYGVKLAAADTGPTVTSSGHGVRTEPAPERSGVRAGARWQADNARGGDLA